MNTKIGCFCAVVLCCNLSPGSQVQLLFSQMDNGDEVLIEYASSGCFHRTHYTISITKRQGRCTAVIRDNQQTEQKDQLDEIELTRKDIQGLDHLLRYYRDRRSGRCTTTDEISISYRENGKEIATDKFTDSTCAIHERRGILSLSELISRLNRK